MKTSSIPDKPMRLLSEYDNQTAEEFEREQCLDDFFNHDIYSLELLTTGVPKGTVVVFVRESSPTR